MEPQVYSHATWKVKPGNEDEFIRTWDSLAQLFSSLPAAPLHGTLIRSRQEPSLFFSFGPWRSEDDIAAMRADPRAQEVFGALFALCETATPGAYSVVRHVVVSREQNR